jgi:hypothetical protein
VSVRERCLDHSAGVLFQRRDRLVGVGAFHSLLSVFYRTTPERRLAI